MMSYRSSTRSTGGGGGRYSDGGKGPGSAQPGSIGREELEKYKGLGFTEKDWKCTLCGNINWARRTQCNTCQTAKPGTECGEGSRQGRGGGFMEREEVVEYRKSAKGEDDIWDEFGRLKKKKKLSGDGEENWSGHAAAQANTRREGVPAEPQIVKFTGRDEEEEDDDDEGEDDGRWAAWDDIISGGEAIAASAKTSKQQETLETWRNGDDDSAKQKGLPSPRSRRDSHSRTPPCSRHGSQSPRGRRPRTRSFSPVRRNRDPDQPSLGPRGRYAARTVSGTSPSRPSPGGCERNSDCYLRQSSSSRHPRSPSPYIRHRDRHRDSSRSRSPYDRRGDHEHSYMRRK